MTSTPSRIRYQEDGSRHGKLLALKSYSSRDPVKLKDFVVGVDICSFLAWKHAMERSGVVVPSLPSRLEGCDFQWDLEMRDDQSNAQQGVRELVAATTNTTESSLPRYTGLSLLPGSEVLPDVTPDEGENSMNSYWTIPQHSAALSTNSYWTVPQQSATSSAHNRYWTVPKHPHTRKRRLQDRHMLTTFNIIEHQDEETSSPTEPEPDWLFPFAVSGPTRSNIAHPTSTLASAHEMPMVSGAATSASLDSSPSFARTIPTDAAPARAVMVYFHSIGVTHCANLFSQDAWGRTYNADLQREANALGITMMSFGYDTNEDDIEATLERLKQSGMRYVYAIIKFDWEFILETAYTKGIVGTNQHVWIGAEATDWTDEGLELSRHTNSSRESILVEALNGIGSLSIYVEESTLLNEAMADFIHNEELQKEFIDLHPEGFIYANYSFAESVNPSASFYHQMFYDATYSILLASCNTPGLFTGPELYQTLVNLEFEGVTGNVTFDTTTGTRSPDSVRFRVDNVFLSNERSDSNYTRFESRLAAIVVNGQVEHGHPFIYHDNTTLPPAPIVILEHDYNLVPVGVQVLGWILGAVVMFSSLATIAWTWLNRKTFVVRASQPVFLITICCGTFVMAAATIPMGMQGKEETQGLDAACMSTVWLIFLGFGISLTALFSKTWRMNQIMLSGISMRRIEVRVTDVIWPLVGFLTLNVTLLIGWSIVSPLSYVRTEGNDYDTYGRSLDSNGHCAADSNNYLYFLIPMLAVNIVGVATATYQSYLSRNLPSEFSEAFYLALSMGCLMETLALGGPILFVANGSPTSFFLVLVLLICTTCLTILLPVFLPKWTHRHSQSHHVLRSTVQTVQHRNGNAVPPSGDGTSSQSGGRGRMSILRPATGSELCGSSRLSGGAGPRVSFQTVETSRLSGVSHRQVGLTFRDIPPSNRNAVVPTESWGGMDLSNKIGAQRGRTSTVRESSSEPQE